MLYSDKFELRSPIRVAKGKHKIFAVIYRVLNFHSNHMTQEKCYNLLLLVKSSSLKSVGLSEIFSLLINELKDL